MPTTLELRQAIDDLTALAAADLRVLWRQVGTADEARDALLDVLPPLTRSYSAAAGTVAADWYDDYRADLGVRGRFSAIPGSSEAKGAEELARWAVHPLYQAEPDWRRAFTNLEGGLQLRIADTARETVTVSSIADPQARGWQRETSPGACSFCDMLAARGAVYSDATVRFAAHDHCSCVAVPAFGGVPTPVKPYTPSDRNITEADRARLRAYLRTYHAG